ncbi:MAG: helix-turn-helix domain-containing protein [Sandaracinus sp.]
MARTAWVLALRGVADGPMGITLDVLGAVTRIVKSGLVPAREVLRPSVVSIDGRSAKSAMGRTVDVDLALKKVRPNKRDVVIVPGLGFSTPREIDEGLARADVREAARWLGDEGARAGLRGASCSATFVLAASGALDGGEATTTWWLGPAFAQRFPRIALRQDRMVVASGGVLTAGSAFAHADLVLSIVGRALGPSLTQLAARYLVLDERPSQARYMVRSQVRTSDPAILAVERAVLGALDETLTIERLAHAAHTSPRTLARRFRDVLGTTPLRFVHGMKMEHASHLLETTSESVEAIAGRVGYADPAAFRRIFLRETGRRPRELRARPVGSAPLPGRTRRFTRT